MSLPEEQTTITTSATLAVDPGDVSVDDQYSLGCSLLAAGQLSMESELPSVAGAQEEEPDSYQVTEVGPVPEVTCLADLVADLGEIED